MRRVNLALFVIIVAIVVFSLLRSVLSGPSGRAVGLKPRSRANPPAVEALNQRPAVDCSLTLDSIGAIGPANPFVIARQWPAKAQTQASHRKTEKNKM
jgi:hypothetical protein